MGVCDCAGEAAGWGGEEGAVGGDGGESGGGEGLWWGERVADAEVVAGVGEGGGCV